MARRYLTFSDDSRLLAVGDYVLNHTAPVDNPDTGEWEILLVITDTRLKGANRSNARYLSPGQHVEIDRGISLRLFMGAQQLRAVIDAPAHLAIRQLRPASS